MNNKKTLISDLPYPIISDILVLLPTKSIMLCKFVCKLWCSLINHPHFRKSSKSISMIVRSETALHLLEPELDFAVVQINENSRFLLGDNASIKFNVGGFDGISLQMLKIVNSCNGLVCLTVCQESVKIWSFLGFTPYEEGMEIPGFWDPFFVCNPVMSDYVVVKQPISAEMATFIEEKHAGFGFCANSGKYKIVRVFCKDKKKSETILHFMADVYTLGSDDEWRRLQNPPSCSYWLDHCLFFKGKLHWIIINVEPYPISVVAFDCEEEIFSVMVFPGFRKLVLSLDSMALAILDSRLCFTISAFDENEEYRCDIWVMNEYGVFESWEKLFVVSPWGKEGLMYLAYLKPLTYWYNGEIVMLSTSKRELISYDVTSKTWRVIEIPGITPANQAVLLDPIFVPTKNLIMQISRN